MRRGEVWWGELPDTGRRPFLILTRDAAIPHLHSVVAAPITRTIRGLPSELRLGVSDGLLTDCAATFDSLTRIPKANLTGRLCALDPVVLHQACAALRAALAC